MANTENVTQKIQERYETLVADYVQSSAAIQMEGCATDRPSDGSQTIAERLYAQDALSDLPDTVTDVSLGCGNPLENAGLLEGDVVLDLGSGGGIDCFMAAKAVGSTGYVIGVDVTEKMVELANRNKVKMGVGNVEFRQGRIEQLPVEDGCVDVIISNCVIDISADKAAVFSEAFRVLKGGGRMAISDTVVRGDIPAGIKANIDRWAGAVITPLISLERYLQYMVEAGFEEIKVTSLSSYGLDNLDALDEEGQRILTEGVDWAELPQGAGLFSAKIVARKPMFQLSIEEKQEIAADAGDDFDDVMAEADTLLGE